MSHDAVSICRMLGPSACRHGIGVSIIVAGAFLALGCSESNAYRGPKLDSMAAEPELPAPTTRRARRLVKLVPNVTRPPEAFRVADAKSLATPVAAAPAILAPSMSAVPAVIATGVGGSLKLTSAEEPRHLEGGDTTRAPLIAQIRDMLADYLKAFNRHDAVAAAAHWAPAAENVNLDTGEVTTGREAVRGVFAALFEVEPAASIDLDVASIRPLRDDVAVIDGVSRVAYEDGEVIASRFSAVVVRQNDAWQLESVREAGATKLPAAPRPLDDLAWLVGAWENVGPGVVAGGRCDWWAGRAYLVRRHSIAPDSAPAEQPKADDSAIPALLPTGPSKPHELTEIIGWDPERQQIRSWIFASDGRFAEATWHRDGDAWRIEIEGRGLDTGRAVTCTIVRGGIDALEVRCEGTGLIGLVPPSCGFTRTGS